MIELSLPFHSRARIWRAALPAAMISETNFVRRAVDTSNPASIETRRAAVEVVRPVGGMALYGLLGGELRPASRGQLEVLVPESVPNGPSFEDAIAGSYEEVRVGLPAEYSGGVIKGVVDVNEQTGKLPSGQLIFNCAAHGKVGSSKSFFRQLSRCVVRLLIHGEADLSADDLRSCIEI